MIGDPILDSAPLIVLKDAARNSPERLGVGLNYIHSASIKSALFGNNARYHPDECVKLPWKGIDLGFALYAEKISPHVRLTARTVRLHSDQTATCFVDIPLHTYAESSQALELRRGADVEEASFDGSGNLYLHLTIHKAIPFRLAALPSHKI